ncbi:phosphoprotein associated with glycosphingolipid-enriched microdomains 1 [Brienomyrus brachyistius]|uniref:phosphoprotein associated with glycosphingolipid-enriched microdomains 1 n=1 Tax=Brienomyrus brachyistius TaxID=42636 RepID=UPI0020B22EDA|nr:phosphoprotein associated with glycosphingolipid-enriched microdomains 1 [Brienomyrus brachyistius]XP_048849389.1 phosphoprotein associated with glycosphingolipid-enriched microdomains 1 [Brienomyrus brachyistius]XP_048849390.1 phosphoprotein associated with glycosphingolipid-enriched microdomains 1 [Brienomyrus brachyistius]
MAPALNTVLGPGALAVAVQPLVGVLTTIAAFLLLLVVLWLCASCQGQKKASGNIRDHENLMNGVSEREGFSQSVESPALDLAASSSQNGPFTSATVLTDDTIDTSPQPSEDIMSNQSELRSSKCPQDRELPSIPPGRPFEEAGAVAQATSGDGTYEMVKETSRDVSVEDSLYETVKELKDSREGSELAVLNGGLIPKSPVRPPLSLGVEYASVDLNKKSRYSTDLDAQRCIQSPTEPESEEEKPPPIPDKVLDENENQQMPCVSAAGMENGELSALYSSVLKPSATEKESDYSSIGEIKSVSESSSSELYATVKDVYRQPGLGGRPPSQEEGTGHGDPGYETIKICESAGKASGAGSRQANQWEPDYESVGELELNREMSRL